MRRRRALVVVANVLVLLVGSAAPAASATDRLPDLGMARLSDLRIDTHPDGRRLLRFTSVIVNVGHGPFEVNGTRPDTSAATMSVTQRIYDEAAGYRDVPTSAALEWSGDGHSHWHIQDLEGYELNRLDNGVLVGTGAKTGFCIWDNTAYRLTLPGAPPGAAYTGCGAPSDTAVQMGLSVGWGDTYRWSTAFQWVDITGLAAGRYRLIATADWKNEFLESNDGNNATWVDLQLRGTGRSVKIIGYGPAA